jgi:hypothetical protein
MTASTIILIFHPQSDITNRRDRKSGAYDAGFAYAKPLGYAYDAGFAYAKPLGGN